MNRFRIEKITAHSDPFIWRWAIHDTKEGPFNVGRVWAVYVTRAQARIGCKMWNEWSREPGFDEEVAHD